MATKREVLDLLWSEPVKIGQWVGFSDLTDLHNTWIKDFLYGPGDQTLLAHRGSYKTTSLSVAIAIHMITKPRDSIGFFRKTDTDVQEVVDQIRNVLKSGAMQMIVRSLYDRDLIMAKETSSELSTNLKLGPRGSSQLVGLGINTSITGKHYDLVATDDIVNLRDRISRAEREKTKVQYQELQNIKNSGGRFINTGTLWHKDDAIGTMPNVTKVDCYSSGLMTSDEIADIRSKMSASLFAANYELKHIASEDVLFGDPQYATDKTLLRDGICHIDAAYGGSDSTAFTALKEQKDGTLIVYGRLWQKHVDECISEIMAAKKDLMLGTTYMERNADKGYLAGKMEALGDTVKTYHESQNKFIKISSHVKANWRKLAFLDSTDPDYMDQVLDYNENAGHDDAPDSLASVIRSNENKIQVRLFHGGI